jgi:hypothetical protein
MHTRKESILLIQMGSCGQLSNALRIAGSQSLSCNFLPTSVALKLPLESAAKAKPETSSLIEFVPFAIVIFIASYPLIFLILIIGVGIYKHLPVITVFKPTIVLATGGRRVYHAAVTYK